MPAVGQGALAIECREDNAELREKLKAIHDETTANTVLSERVFLKKLNGGCQVPIAGLSKKTKDGYQLTGLVGAADGSMLLQEIAEGTDPVQLGEEVADRLLKRGAKAILDQSRDLS